VYEELAEADLGDGKDAVLAGPGRVEDLLKKKILFLSFFVILWFLAVAGMWGSRRGWFCFSWLVCFYAGFFSLSVVWPRGAEAAGVSVWLHCNLCWSAPG
jgi:hypothetical protein